MFSINLIFVDTKTIRRFNKKYRQIDKAATVLSFNYGEKGQAKFPSDSGETGCLGEIVICLSEAKKQNLSIEELVIHGLKNILSEIPTSKNK